MAKFSNKFIIGPFVNCLYIKFLKIILKPKSIILDTSLPQKYKTNSFEKFFWNRNNPSAKLKIKSLAFQVFDKFKLKNKSNFSDLFFDDKNYFKLYQDIEKKILLEKITHILLTFGVANNFVSNDLLYIILPQSYKSIYKIALEYITKEKNCIIKYNKNIKPIFVGHNFLDLFLSFINSLGIVLFFFSSIRKIKKESKKFYKIGLLAWNASLNFYSDKKERFGLDAVLPESLDPKNVLIYSKSYSSKEYELESRKKNYGFINFNNKEIYKYVSLKDLSELFFITKNLFFIFLKKGNLLEPFLVSEYPRIIYFFLQWNKFVKSFYFDLSISYNDYGISDLIRNGIFLKNNITCWAYAHSFSQSYIYCKSPFLVDPSKAFVTFSKRYYLLNDQLMHYKLSRIKCNDNVLIGPLFRNHKTTFNFRKNYRDKFIISIFTCSTSSNTFNSNAAHKKFFNHLFKLMAELDDKYIFLIKLKNKKLHHREFDYIFKANLYDKLEKNNRIFFVDSNQPSSTIIKSSNFIISMAFTSPTFEALSANKPAVFFDPEKTAKNNYLENIDNLYMTDWKILKLFIENFKDKEINHSWILKTKSKIGLKINKSGILKIQKDISNYLSKK